MNEEAFLKQVEENQGIIYKLVGLYAADTEERKDYYQEILLQAWKSWPAFRKESKFSTWLYRICLNTIFTQQRKKHPVEYKESLETVAPPVPSRIIQKEESLRLQQAIKTLPETDRAIISLNLDGYENGEIAEILGISNNHVAVKLHRIKIQLANLLTH